MNEKPIKIIGKIVLAETDPRTEPWVVKKLDKSKGEHDYFLSLEIQKIGDLEVKKIQDAFNALKAHFPKITFQDQSLNGLFVDAKVPLGVQACIHITLGNFPDFRCNRDHANDVDAAKVANAKALEGQIVEFEVSEKDFELVAKGNVEGVNLSKGKTTTAPTVGFNRDAVLNIKPSEQIQEQLKGCSKKVFGDDFELWNAQKQVVPYHITIAQTNELTKTLDSIKGQNAGMTLQFT